MSQRVCFIEIEMIKGGNVYTFTRLKEEPMTEFEKLVSEQMKTMDKLLDLQSELDRANKLKQNSGIWKGMQGRSEFRMKLR